MPSSVWLQTPFTSTNFFALWYFVSVQRGALTSTVVVSSQPRAAEPLAWKLQLQVLNVHKLVQHNLERAERQADFQNMAMKLEMKKRMQLEERWNTAMRLMSRQ